MAQNFSPLTPADGPSWLPRFANSISDLFRRIMPAPLRLKDYATVDLPAAADFSAGLAWDSTLLTFKISDGTNWLQYAAFGSGVLSFNTRIGAVTLSSGDVTTALGYTPTSITGSTGAQTVTQITAALNVFSSTLKGLAPLSGGGTANYLRADGTWAAPPGATSGTVTTLSVVTANGVSGSVANPTTTPAITITLGAITPSSVAASGTVTGSNLSGTNSGDQTITLTGDVTGSGTGSFAATIANSAVTLAKMANMATASILGRNTAGTGAPEILSASTTRSLLGLVIGTNVQAWDADLDTWATITPASGIGTFLVTPSSANLAAAVTNETGSGALVFANTPALVTPDIGAATGATLVLSGAATVKGDVNVWGGNAALAGGLSANSGGGGLYIFANGTNQNIRLVPTGVGFVQSTTDLVANGSIVANTYLRSGSYTVATLPAVGVAGAAARAAVTDALAPTFLGIIVGGGLVFTGVICDGTNWRAD